MGELIIILSISFILAAFIVYHIYKVNTYGRIMYDQQLDYMRMCDKHQESVDNYNELLDKYSKSLDKHEAAYNELNNRYKIAQAQIEAKDLEIIGLQTKVDYLREHQDPCETLAFDLPDDSDKENEEED